MKAQQFIKDHGVENVRTLIDQFEKDQFAFKSFDPAADCCFDTGLYAGKEKDWWDVCIYDLQRLVESVDLVNAYGGIESCKQSLYMLHELTEDPQPIRDAVRDYESIYGEWNE